MRRRTLMAASLGLGTLAASAWMATRSGDDASAATQGPPRLSRSGPAFGTTVTLTVLHDDAAVATAALDDALQRVQAVDALMSLYREDSQLARLNRHGVLEAPDPMLLQVLAEAQQLSRRTAGAFDVTVQPLWQAFAAARQGGGLPTPAERAAARARVGWQRLDIAPDRLRLRDAGMAVTLNGLAQGHGVDVALQALREWGITQALLDTGEFGALGGKAAGAPWRLGIRHPRHSGELAARLALDGRCLATSGDYESGFSADFVHHHIFDPATGDSPTTLASATVLAGSGILADGLSTAFMVMGAERSLQLAAEMPGVDALLIGKDGRRWQTPGMAALAA